MVILALARIARALPDADMKTIHAIPQEFARRCRARRAGAAVGRQRLAAGFADGMASRHTMRRTLGYRLSACPWP
jgi:hypothetical protein